MTDEWMKNFDLYANHITTDSSNKNNQFQLDSGYYNDYPELISSIGSSTIRSKANENYSLFNIGVKDTAKSRLADEQFKLDTGYYNDHPRDIEFISDEAIRRKAVNNYRSIQPWINELNNNNTLYQLLKEY